MSSFDNVSILKKANVYFDGKVTSRTITLADGSSKTLGIMLPGEYLFNTDAAELMEIIDGELSYQITNTAEWIDVKSGESFNVPSSSSFTVKVNKISDYCCSYIN